MAISIKSLECTKNESYSTKGAWERAPAVLKDKKSWLVVRVEDSKVVGALSTVEAGTAVLSLLNEKESEFYRDLLRLQKEAKAPIDLPATTEALIEDEVKKFAFLPKREAERSRPRLHLAGFFLLSLTKFVCSFCRKRPEMLSTPI